MKKEKLDFNLNFEINGETYQIRTLQNKDIQTIREWKNENRMYFHFQNIISADDQIKWYEKFQINSEQQIYVLEKGNSLLACVGYKIKKPNRVELFNLMRSIRVSSKSGFMHVFFKNTLVGLKNLGFHEMELEVLKVNTTAINWYYKQGFKLVSEEKDFLNLLLEF